MNEAQAVDRAHHLLRRGFGHHAEFRDGQLQAIIDVAVHKHRLLVVQRTGWGKSLVYFIATKLLREQGRGPTVVVSPLLSLMRNQVAAARQFGLRIGVINSANEQAEHRVIADEVRRNRLDLLIVAPERFDNHWFLNDVWNTSLRDSCGLFVIDEAHCISDWGHDFRLSYRRLLTIINALPRNTPILGTTATANQRVTDDIQALLGSTMKVMRGSLVRDSLRLYAIHRTLSAAERHAMIHQVLSEIKDSGIIYCLTVDTCNDLAAWLTEQGHAVAAYHAQLDNQTREALEDKLLRNEVKALVATIALGMGFDKPDLGFVIHYQMPASIVGYYQQVGRAGRGIDRAIILLMHGDEDDEINGYFLKTAFPQEEEVKQVLKALKVNVDVTLWELLRRINISKTKLERVIEHLVTAGIVTRSEGVIRRLNSNHLDMKLWSAILERREREYAEMYAYLQSETCLMQYITSALGDTTSQKCNQCAACTAHQPIFRSEYMHIVEQAAAHLTPKPFAVELRSKLPIGLKLTDISRDQVIPRDRRTVMVLARYADPLGQKVSEGKYQLNRFDDELVDLASRWVREYADQFWGVRPRWITAVPSLRRQLLVPDFAKRLAQRLGLPYRPMFVKVLQTREQKTMQNSFAQLSNLLGSLELDNTPLLSPVLLIDDMVDSAWTLTHCAALLEFAGCPAVLPFALASTRPNHHARSVKSGSQAPSS